MFVCVYLLLLICQFREREREREWFFYNSYLYIYICTSTSQPYLLYAWDSSTASAFLKCRNHPPLTNRGKTSSKSTNSLSLLSSFLFFLFFFPFLISFLDFFPFSFISLCWISWNRAIRNGQKTTLFRIIWLHLLQNESVSLVLAPISVLVMVWSALASC